MNIGFISTSRADFGIYRPLIDRIIETEGLNYLLFIGGMHTTNRFGNSWKLIEGYGYEIAERLSPLDDNDNQEGIAKSMGETLISYGRIWDKYKSQLDLIIVLGDRFEMFAAVASVIPFNIPIAHLHGGEETKGAIDNKFRDAISVLSDIHFTSTENHCKKVKNLTASEQVYNVGSMGIEAALSVDLIEENEFEQKFKVSISEGFILTTYHPETIALNNEEKIEELIQALKEIPVKVLCTLPNADTEGTVIRNKFIQYEREFPEKIVCFENLGQLGYYSAMAYCKMMIGNTSSGIIESAAFNKMVIDVGNRQEGRERGRNVINVPNKREEIINAYRQFNPKKSASFDHPFGKGNTSFEILEILSQLTK